MSATTTLSESTVRSARNAVGASFALNGLIFATLVSRLPDIRHDLDLSNSALGVLLLAGSLGSMLALPISGRVIERISPAATVRLGAAMVVVGLLTLAVGATVVDVFVVALAGNLVYGMGVSLWDVAMNLEGAEVERHLRRTVMPRFHAGWSMGSIAGSALGIPMAALHVPVVLHCLGVLVVACSLTVHGSRSFLPVAPKEKDAPPRVSAWREPRTLMIGVLVLCFAIVEGSANDWLSLAIIDGYDTPHWVGVAGFSGFVIAMTVGRMLGPVALDRIGRAPMLWASAGASAVGVLVAVYGGSLPVMFAGIVLWGLGSALGFPVGISAAADDPARAAARVSVVASVAYSAFFVGPPLLGVLGDQVGTLRALTVVALLMVPAAFAVLAARPQSGAGVTGDRVTGQNS